MDELTIDMLPLNEEELAWGWEEPESWYTDMIQETQDAQADIIKQKKTVKYQTMLKQAGYYKGKIDGIWGRQTEAAYQQYINDAKGKGNRLVVSRGDTLSQIANKYGVTVDQIMAINSEIKDRNKIKVDQVINLPYFIRKSSQKSNTSDSRPSKVSRAANNTSSKQNQQKQSQKPQKKTTATNADQNRQNAPHLKKDYSGLRLMLATTPGSILDGRKFFSDFSRLSNIPPRIPDKWKPGMPLTGGYTPF